MGNSDVRKDGGARMDHKAMEEAMGWRERKEAEVVLGICRK